MPLKARALSSFLFGIFLVIAVTVVPHTTLATTPSAGSIVTLQDANSKLCIDTGGSTAFTYLVQSPCSTNKSQQFTLKASPTSGWYYLVSVSSKLCWDIWNGSSSPGALLQQYTCTAVAPEYFQLKAVSGGYEILSRNLVNGCIDVAGASVVSGAHLEQNSCSGVENQVFTASVVNSQPQVSVVPNSASFGSVVVGTKNTQTIKLTNSGTANLTVSQANVSGTANGFSTSGLTLPLTLPPGQSANFSVAFAPAAVSSVSGSVSLVSNAPSSPLAIPLSGSGIAATYVLGANPISLSFGNVNVASTGTLNTTVSNSGNSNVTLSSATSTNARFTVSGITPGTILSPGQSAALHVAFAPTVAGALSGSVSVASNATNSPATIAVSGTGISLAPPTVTIASPADGATVSGTVAVAGTASAAAGLSSVQVQVDGGAFSSASGTTNWTFSLATGSLSNAAHTLTARATDTSGATATSSSSINVSNSGTTINVVNFGAKGDGTTDDTSAINSAIASLTSGATLLFPCGTYKTSAQLTINISNVTIDGSSCAILHNTSSGTVMVIGGSGNGNPNYGPAVALSSTANELASSFSTVASLGVAAGDYVLLQQGGKDSSNGSGNTGCDPSGCRGELLKVASVSSNSITVTTALHDTYNPSVNAATAQKIVAPLTGVTVKNITFDGNASNVYGLAIAGVADSTITGVTSRNVQGAALLNRGDFNVAWSNITVTAAGSAQCGSAVWFEKQGNLSINGLSISKENPGAPGSGCLANGAFGFELQASANSTITNLSVDASGAYGRPFKTSAARYNTFNSPTVKNGVQAYNGISLEYYSSHNTYNSCVVTNNGAGTGTGTGNAGIITFGNFNQYNTFNNCTVSGNGNVQFYISGYDALRLAQDSHNSVSGGSFTGSNSSEAVLLIEGDATYITGTTINGPGPQGIYLDTQASNACVNDTTFTPGSSLGSAISANGTGDLGLGNILNLLGSNLALGTCGPPLP